MVVKMEEGYSRVAASAYAWSLTAAPMLSGTLITAVGFMPNGFARSGTGEYTGNMFWIVGIALIASWVVAVVFTPYLGVKLLPEFKKTHSSHAALAKALYDTPRYNRFRQLLGYVIARKWIVAGSVIGLFVVSVLGMAVVKKQFFPISDRPEVLIEVQMPYGTSITQTSAAAEKVEAWLSKQKEAKTVTAYVGQGAPRFYLAMGPELPDPSFAKIVVRTDNQDEREALKQRLREAVAAGLASEARVRVTQLVFGPYSPFPVAYRVSGSDPEVLRNVAAEVEQVMDSSPLMRTVNTDWGARTPTLHFTLQQDRLQAFGLTSSSVAQQLQFLLNGIPVTAVREDIRTVQVVARSAGNNRLDPAKIGDFTLAGANGQRIPLSQVGKVEVRMEEPIMRRRDRVPTITVRGDIAEGLAAAGRVDGHYPATPAHHEKAAEWLQHRRGRLQRRIRQGDGCHAADLPYHAGDYAAHYHPASALNRGNGDGLPDQSAGADRRGSDADPLPAAIRHQCAGWVDCVVGHPHAQHADLDRADS